jgi:hypothetical protein
MMCFQPLPGAARAAAVIAMQVTPPRREAARQALPPGDRGTVPRTTIECRGLTCIWKVLSRSVRVGRVLSHPRWYYAPSRHARRRLNHLGVEVADERHFVR